MRRSESFDLCEQSVGAAAGFVETCLKEFGINSSDSMKSTLIAEEALGSLVAHASSSGQLRVSVYRFFGNITVEMSAPGSEYPLLDNMQSAAIPDDDEMGRDALDVIRNIMLRSFADDLKYRHKDGYNSIRMTLLKSKRSFLYATLAALAAAIVIGLIMSAAAPEAVNKGIDYYFLSPVKTIYINLLKVIVAPVVFFSIVSCIGGFSNLRELGKVGAKTILLYTLTTLIAVSVGIGVFYLFQPGKAGLAAGTVEGAAGNAAASLSLRDLLVGLAPSNFVSPFLNDNMPQLIILAVLCGIAAGLIGQYSVVLRSLFDACNELFMKIASMIIKFMPLAIFCSAASMIISTGAETLLSIAGMFGSFIFGLMCMMIIYIILVAVLGRLDPRPLIRKYAPTMLQVFSMASSNAAIPINMSACNKKLGISNKICGLSIPLGSTLNMDGTCVQLAVFALALAKVYGTPVYSSGLITMAVTIVILSMGAPGMPGGTVICLSVLLEQLGVPTEAVGLVMGIGPLLGMFLCMSNCVGDVVVTSIVARSAGEIDMDVYRK
ncbi:MAG: cation:dicarboxylase symporter family transporter [Lachnospiraceae bacterium]|nr:cation:dicarboxylase symporter family transporter [Lachnospiraceae bacterium]